VEVQLVSCPSHFTPQGKIPHYPLDRMMSGPQSQSGRGGEEKNFQPSNPTIQPIACCYTN